MRHRFANDADRPEVRYPNGQGILYLLFFLSGTAGLVYEVLWMKELGVLFGNTAHAVATTLTVFFLGLSTGGLVWGHKSRRLKNPLLTYSCLELGIAATAGLYFFILRAYRELFAPLYALVGNNFPFFVAVKFLLAVGILFLPAFFMGGTLPVMGQHLIRRQGELSGKGTLLYAVNTAGACLGAFLAGFVLPSLIGIRSAYLIAIAINILVGAMAGHIAIGFGKQDVSKTIQPSVRSRIATAGLPAYWLWPLAFASGFLTLGLEVLWTRMFSQAHQNSVYLFSSILIVFLAALATGSYIANRLSRTTARPASVVAALLLGSAILVIHTPLFFQMVGGAQPEGYYQLGWGLYIHSIFQSVLLVVFVPVAVMGCILPFLLKLAEHLDYQPGQIIGRLVAANTAGALLGSLFAGFIFLEAMGLSNSIRIFSTAYALITIGLIATATISKRQRLVMAAGITLLAFLLVTNPFRQSMVTLKEGETLLEMVEGSHASLSVVRASDGELSMRTNNHYGLGSAKNFRRQRLEASIPLSLHPAPEDVFFLGMGTGITAGAALDFPIKRLTVCEMMPEAVALSRKHFTPYVNGLFKDPRVNVVVEDGRTFLHGTSSTYDVIVADLFLPYRAGVGGLYSADHYQVVQSRLRPGGIFAQWLSIYQFSREDYEIIEKTVLSVFDQVTVWRADFDPYLPFVLIVCQKDSRSLDVEKMAEFARNIGIMDGYRNRFNRITGREMLTLYGGNLGAFARRIPEGPVNTDNRPLIEFKAPLTIRNIFSGHVRAMNGDLLHDYFAALLSQTPPDKDPFLSQTTVADRQLVLAGQALFGAEVYKVTAPERSQSFAAEFLSHLDLTRSLKESAQ